MAQNDGALRTEHAGYGLGHAVRKHCGARCAVCGCGVILTLVIYGFLQEKVMTVSYDGELFKYSAFLVFCNRVAVVLFATTAAACKGEPLENKAPLWKYLVISLSNVYGSFCQYEALKYVSFTVQMLCKSFRIMPVMIWGILISGKHYGKRDFMVAMVITLGTTEFIMSGPTASRISTESSSFYGFLCLGLFLVLDGLTSTIQEKLFKEYQTSEYNQMIYVNSLSACVSLCTLVASGQLQPAVAFAMVHPAFGWDVTMLSTAAVASQVFIYSQVKEFGALVFAATVNMRQVISVLYSVAAFHHDVTKLQFVGLATVFVTLFYKSFAALTDEPTKGEKMPALSGQSYGAACEGMLEENPDSRTKV
eukprot:TRINITY_DN42707_c0_g1_i1.p1 TRINITY_DN42707_c0_g1~~TRINITY_DN42707_c0_g1_i1.p1  ORF type:complete len:364 (-),score=51.21 TRINITY_DN42707_c0_g1_i1:82-1173(-)